MKTQFTKGPWQQCKGIIYHKDTEGDEAVIASVDPHSLLDFSEANAHLIAAAPELYEALEEMMGAVANARSAEVERARGDIAAAERHEKVLEQRFMIARNALGKASPQVLQKAA